MDTSTKIYNSFFEDDNGDVIFFNNGKNSVLGLAQADHCMKNTNNHTYARIAFYTLSDVGDDLLAIHINENLHVDLLSDLEDTKTIKSYRVYLQGYCKAGRVIKESVKGTVFSDMITNPEINPKVYFTEDSYLEDNVVKYGLGVWIEIGEYDYVLTTILSSLSINHSPVNIEHYPSSYSAEYLNNQTKSADINLTNIQDMIVNNMINVATPANQYINERLNILENKTKNLPFAYIQNSVWYDNTYEPTNANKEELVQPISVRGTTTDRIVALDPVNKSFSVLKAGVYSLQLKNGFYLAAGESHLDMIVYKNTDVVQEMKMSLPLHTQIKDTRSSNMYMVKLKPTDKIYLRANWSDIEDISCENETIITITAFDFD